MQVNFKEISVKNIDGTKVQVDLSKEIANFIYATTKDVGELELSRNIYNNGSVDLTEKQSEMVLKIVEENFIAVVKEALVPMLKAEGTVEDAELA